jgi:hypothetical protein
METRSNYIKGKTASRVNTYMIEYSTATASKNCYCSLTSLSVRVTYIAYKSTISSQQVTVLSET